MQSSGSADEEDIVSSATPAFSEIPDMYQQMAYRACGIVENYILFKKSLLIPGEVHMLIEKAWNRSQKGNRQLERIQEVDIHVC